MCIRPYLAHHDNQGSSAHGTCTSPHDAAFGLLQHRVVVPSRKSIGYRLKIPRKKCSFVCMLLMLSLSSSSPSYVSPCSVGSQNCNCVSVRSAILLSAVSSLLFLFFLDTICFSLSFVANICGISKCAKRQNSHEQYPQNRATDKDPSYCFNF